MSQNLSNSGTFFAHYETADNTLFIDLIDVHRAAFDALPADLSLHETAVRHHPAGPDPEQNKEFWCKTVDASTIAHVFLTVYTEEPEVQP